MNRYDNRYRQQPPRNGRESSRARNALGLMFSPNFGTSLSVLKDTGYMFIQILAMIFAQANLIDKRHPAVTGSGDRKYGLFEIIQMAYERVEWRQENIAQISLFLAVCCSIAICALGIVFALFSVVFSTV